MQANTSRTTLSAQSSGTPSASTISSAGKQQVVELSGYVIILVENVDGKIKLYGSPSDRDNLEVGDEILEVNGLTLDNISRTEAIRHIHDCIKSCTICLRVRKKNDTRLAWDIGNSVQDAFVIAVEEHARERLQRLAALNRVTPVDITQLSKKLQQSKSGTHSTQKQDLSFLNEASPIYVTSFTSNQITCSSSTVTTATAGLITTSQIATANVVTCATTSTTALATTTKASATAAASIQSTTAKTPSAITTITKALITPQSSIPADRNANTATAAILGATAAAAAAATAAATAKIANHNIYQQQQHHLQTGKLQQQHKPQIATSLQHLPVAEEDDDDDEDLVAGAANYCSINFINYNNKNAQITATAPLAVAATAIQTPAVVTTTVTVIQHPQQLQQLPQQLQHLQHRPPPLQIPSAILVDAQTSTSPLAATIIDNNLPIESNNVHNNVDLHDIDDDDDEDDDIVVRTAVADGTRTPKTEYTTAISSSHLQQAFAGYPQQKIQYNNINNNNNNIPAAATAATIATALNQQPATILNSSTLSNNNNSNNFVATTIGIQQKQQQQQQAALYGTTLSGNSKLPSATTTNATNTIAAAVVVGTSNNFSNNCDVLISNNILHPPRRELLTSVNEDTLFHYDHDDNKLNSIKLIASNNTNNILLNSHLYDKEQQQQNQQQQQQQQQLQIQHQNQLQNSSPTSSISIGRTELLLGDQSLRQDIRPRRRSGSSIVVIDGDDLKPCLPDDYISSQHYRQHTNDTKEIDQEMLTMLSVNQDNGPHREMAVDCPENFIARNKTPPRYPPPRPVQSKQQQSTTNAPKLSASLNSLQKQKLITNSNPNGSASGTQNAAATTATSPTQPDDLEIMLDGCLYRKDSSSHSSNFDEALSKKSSESFDSITYRHLHNNNNHSNNNSNSTSSTTATPPPNALKPLTNGIALMQSSCGDSLHSTRSSNSSTAIDEISGGMPPPEYELRELTAPLAKNSIKIPLMQTTATTTTNIILKHRELPVDVPDSFIEIIKTTPRYPPPPHLSSLTSHNSNSSASTANTTLTHLNSLSATATTTATTTSTNNTTNNNSNSNHNVGTKQLTTPTTTTTTTLHSIKSSTNTANTNTTTTTTTNTTTNTTTGTSTSATSAIMNNDCSFFVVDLAEQSTNNAQSLKLLKKQKSSSTSSFGSLENLDKFSAAAAAATTMGTFTINGQAGAETATDSQSKSNTTTRNDELNGSVKPVPPPRDHLRIEKDGRLINRTPAPQLPDRRIVNNVTAITTTTQPKHIAQIIEPTPEQLDSIKKYQEQLRRRREEEELIAQQNEFLRNSLRGSRKLKALQDNKIAVAQPQQPVPAERVTGVENEAYLEDEEAEKINGYGELIAALTRLQNTLTKNGMSTLAGRVSSAHNVLGGAGVAHALAARQAVLQRRRPVASRGPVTANATDLQKDIVEVLAQSNSAAAIELGNLLTSHEMEGLLLAHDRVATLTDPTPSPALSGVVSPDVAPATMPKSASVRGTAVAPPVVPTPMAQRGAMPLPANVIASQAAYLKNNAGMPLRADSPPLSACFGTLNDQNDNIRIIQIEKSVEPLGATVLNQGEAVVIGRIVRGGAADKSGLLHEGDEILEVNGQELRGKTVHEVCALLGSMQGTLTFLIVPAGSPPPGGGIRENAVLHVRAHFDYDPEDDLYIPCRELGISFQKGDVLHVISRDDPKWWQAYREGEEDQTLAGLIPSQMYQHQREAIKLESLAASRDRDGKNNKSATLLCALKGRKKKRKKASSEAGYPLYATTAPDETEPEEILTYEEVALYYPRATHKRPIVLIGPPNIGRHELRQRLMADSERFAAAVPHTSRARREGEVPGVDYHFITRQAFEADILARRFVEHGEYEKAYYGTSLEAIRTVVASGKICVLNLHPQSLKLLRASDLKPYVVLVAPPSLEKLRQKKIRNGEPFKEEELKDIIATARDMEARWGHLFDMIIINNDTERAYHQLLAEINSLEREPQWVPASWVYNNRDES